tara:strand:- start:62 stop:2242 length:2181 start_codon:yes stop_codon:yes gene_type:complete
MPVNIEIKGNLARLLATENLIVEHKKVETAQFNVHTRVLTLPMWNTASNYVYDMLVAHEVGHALFTPNTMWKEGEYADLPMAYVNIVEDARIEKLMKNKFAGLNRDFFKGYEELNAQDFFELRDKDINQLKFIDKINLYFKLGAHLCLEFNDIENEFITEISKADTFEQVLDISKRVYTYSKQQQEKRQQESLDQVGDSNDVDEDSGDDFDTDNTLEKTDDNGIDAEADLDDPEFDPTDSDDDNSAGKSGGDWNNIDESDTQESFEHNSERLIDKHQRETNYVTIPELNLDKVVVPFDTIKSYLAEHFESESKNSYSAEGIEKERLAYNEYKKSASKDVNNLVKEFEMKKSADSYARQATAKTGVLNTSKLHTYMYNEDLFKKVTVIPEGKNHGLVFLLDWSGSMNNILNDTIKQLFNLVWFCRKSNIAFEVYAFSNDAWSLGMDINQMPQGYGGYAPRYDVEQKSLVNEIVEGDLALDGTFRMVNILTSKAKSKDINEMMYLLWLQTIAFRGHWFASANRFALSGTPLNEAIIAVGQLTKQLMKTSKLQKCHVITLTDGEGFSASYNKMSESYYGNEVKMRQCGVAPWDTVIRVGSRSFVGANNEPEFTCKLVEAVKSKLDNVNFVAIRILERGGLHRFYSYYGRNHYYNDAEMKEQLKKKGLVSFASLSFDMWFALQQTSLHNDDQLEVEAGAAKRSITAAFRKMNKSKKSNKFLVKEFIKQIA